MVKRALTRVSLALTSMLLATMAFGQTDDYPKTEFGHPDLQGTYTFRTITPLNRPRELEHLETLTPEQAAEWEQFELRRQNRDLIIDSVGGAGYPPGVISYNNFWYERGENTVADRRTSLIYDPQRENAPSERCRPRACAAYGQMVFESAGPEGRTTVDRCLVGFVAGPPMIPGSYNNNMQIVQTKDQVMILNEMVHSARIIRLDSEHNTKQLKWEGDSVGYWEGDTLVIHTENWYQTTICEVCPNKLMEERIKRIDDTTLGMTLQSMILSWDEPWSAKFPLRDSADPIYEYACHEGNHGLVGILAGWRYQES